MATGPAQEPVHGDRSLSERSETKGYSAGFSFVRICTMFCCVGSPEA